MGKANRSNRHRKRSKTLPSSPSHSFSSSSSSDFEFTIAISPRNKSSTADELFYKGQLLPLHLSPRISMVRTLQFLSSSSASTSTSTSRDSNGSSDSSTSCHISLLVAAAAAATAASTTCDSSRPSSVADEDVMASELVRSHHDDEVINNKHSSSSALTSNKKLPIWLSRFSNVFKNNNSKDVQTAVESNSRCVAAGDNSGREVESAGSGSGMRRMVASSTSAKEVIRKYLKKVKPLYEKLSTKHQQRNYSGRTTIMNEKINSTVERPSCSSNNSNNSSSSSTAPVSSTLRSHSSVGSDFGASSFSGNLPNKVRRSSKRSYVASCPSSMRSSPSHSGVLNRTGLPSGGVRSGDGGGSGTSSTKTATSYYNYSDTSTMEELQNAIQGAIAHCKNSMLQQNNWSSKGKAHAAVRSGISKEI